MTSEEDPALILFKSSHDEMRELIKQNNKEQLTSNSLTNGVACAEDPAVTRFREYIRIETVQPNPDNDGAMKFLARYARNSCFRSPHPHRYFFSDTLRTWGSPISRTSVFQGSRS